jgi:predicted transcriptional regulator
VNKNDMSREFAYMIDDILNLLGKDLGQPVQEPARGLGVGRAFLAGYIKALVSQGHVRSKKVGPVKVCFKRTGEG